MCLINKSAFVMTVRVWIANNSKVWAHGVTFFLYITLELRGRRFIVCILTVDPLPCRIFFIHQLFFCKRVSFNVFAYLSNRGLWKHNKIEYVINWNIFYLITIKTFFYLELPFLYERRYYSSKVYNHSRQVNRS